MVNKKCIKAIEILKYILNQRGINIDKIAIFGSYAKGKQKKGSDIDIIIVSKDFEDKDIFERISTVRGLHGELVKKINMPADIMYYSPAEWKKGSSLIIQQAKEKGQIYT